MKYAWFFLYISAIFLWYTGTCFYGYDDMDILYKNVFNPQRVVDWMLLILGFPNKLPKLLYLAHIGESILLIKGPRPFPVRDETYTCLDCQNFSVIDFYCICNKMWSVVNFLRIMFTFWNAFYIIDNILERCQAFYIIGNILDRCDAFYIIDNILNRCHGFLNH